MTLLDEVVALVQRAAEARRVAAEDVVVRGRGRDAAVERLGDAEKAYQAAMLDLEDAVASGVVRRYCISCDKLNDCHSLMNSTCERCGNHVPLGV